VTVSGARPAAERAWLMSARTWAAGLPGAAPAEPVAGAAGDAADDGAAGLEDGDADGVEAVRNQLVAVSLVSPAARRSAAVR
jgi:hypothetical protein